MDAQAGFQRIRRILEGQEVVPPEEYRQFPEQVAREYARAEARRKPEQQLSLPEAA